ncbi:MAG: BREX-3 system P-loop-containing protein BrxF [Christensenellaceae bacterium]
MQNSTWLLKPIIYCCPNKAVIDQAVSLNKELAQALILYKSKRRTMQIEKCFAEVIDKLPDESIIKDFDVLFNPDYKVDVLKIMINTCKAKPFGVIWPGNIDDNRLTYAEEGYIDYKTYDVNDYDITCII